MQGLEIVLVNIGEAQGHVRDTVRTRGYRARVALDTDRAASDEYGVRATPTVFLVNRKGLVVGRAVGMGEWSGAPARAVIQALLAEPP